MRIECHSIDDFITNLWTEPPGSVMQKQICVDVTSRDVDGIKFMINIQATAVIDLPDGGQYLLQAGEDCGIDYRDTTQDYAGSEKMEEQKDKLKNVCEELGLTIRPGVIGF